MGKTDSPYTLQIFVMQGIWGIFMVLLQHAVAVAREYLWGFPMLALLFGTHLYFTFHLGFIQKKIPLGIRLSLTGTKNQEKDQVTPYSALATALAATIGTGNIVGISTAIAIGGPGAVFWCWLTGVFGIATCYAECYLSIRYRVRRTDSTFAGGPMYILDRRLKKRKLAAAFAVCTLLASFGIGSSVQSYSIRTALQHQITVSPHLVGMAVGVLAGIIIIGGNSQIAKVCMWLVPLMSAFYVGGCLYIIGRNRAVLPETLALILSSAVCPKAVAGGCTGGALLLGIQTGVSRGLFTNEAGLGSIPMVAATAASSSDSPKEAAVRQALISMTGPFWDTVVLCAITGIAAVGSMVSHPQEYRGVAPENMCFVAFRELPVGGEWMLSISLTLFAFATIIGWNVYGTCAVRYLWGEAGVRVYQVAYMFFAYLGAVLSMELVWGISDLLNSLMALPNLLCLWMLRGEIATDCGKGTDKTSKKK